MADIVPIKDHDDFKAARRSAASVLAGARTRKSKEILVMGIDDEGEFFCLGHPNNPAEALWLMELARRKLVP